MKPSEADRDAIAAARMRDIEQDAFDAWPAAETERLGNWRMRFNDGVTNRANSVWAFDAPDRELGNAISEVEAFYRARSRPAIFQLSPMSAPSDLDAQLAERGYRRHSPVAVQVADAARLPPLTGLDGIEVTTHEELAADWFAISGERGRYRGAEIATYRRMMERVSERACFVVARHNGALAGAGLGVAGRVSTGVFSMLTLDEHRRSGVGRAVLDAIAKWSLRRDKASLYLQVEEDNRAAQALYRRAGFETLYGYAYRQSALEA